MAAPITAIGGSDVLVALDSGPFLFAFGLIFVWVERTSDGGNAFLPYKGNVLKRDQKVDPLEIKSGPRSLVLAPSLWQICSSVISSCS